MSEIKITQGGKERLDQAAAVLWPAFDDDPAIAYMLCHLTREERIAYLPQYIRTLLLAAALNGAVFCGAADWGSVAVWLPPGRKVDNVWTFPQTGMFSVLWKCGLGGCYRMLGEFQTKANAAKKKGLKGQKRFYYLWFLGTAKDRQGKGLGSALVRDWQPEAVKENVPIWLEATTARSRDMYARCGFELVEAIHLGKGKCDANGIRKKDGEGFRIYSMIWWPPVAAEKTNGAGVA